MFLQQENGITKKMCKFMQNAWFNKKEFGFPLKSVKLKIKLLIISKK